MKCKLDLSREYGLVLEGGGAKGAYQVGVWRALREAGVRIGAVSGTSIGAINGAMVCMDRLEEAEAVWENMSYRTVFDVEPRVIADLKKLNFRTANFAEMAAEMRRIVKDRGLNIDPLRELLTEYIDEDRIRTSDCELYVTTFCVSDVKEVNFDVRNAPEGAMKDMILASAYMPGFKNEKIFGKTYLDGGSVNNVPIDVLTERGYRDIIVVRIFGVGVDREAAFSRAEGVTTYRVAPHRNLGGILEFDAERAKRNLKLGYYDGMRMLYDLEGRKYYIDLPHGEAYYFERLMAELDVLQLYLTPYVKEDDTTRVSGYRAYTERIFPFLAKKLKLKSDWDYRTLYGAILELCAKKLNLEVFQIYGAEDIIGHVRKALGETMELGIRPADQ